MKKCPCCKKNKALSDFSWKSKAMNKRHSECRLCHREMRKSYYRRNKEREKERVFLRKKALQKWLAEYKKSLKCSKCPESHPACLEFHHKSPEGKDLNIAQAAQWGWSPERALQEIRKCVVLCSNCHKKHHWGARVTQG